MARKHGLRPRLLVVNTWKTKCIYRISLNGIFRLQTPLICILYPYSIDYLQPSIIDQGDILASTRKGGP